MNIKKLEIEAFEIDLIRQEQEWARLHTGAVFETSIELRGFYKDNSPESIAYWKSAAHPSLSHSLEKSLEEMWGDKSFQKKLRKHFKKPPKQTSPKQKLLLHTTPLVELKKELEEDLP